MRTKVHSSNRIEGYKVQKLEIMHSKLERCERKRKPPAIKVPDLLAAMTIY
jgi:hypothetical protein